MNGPGPGGPPAAGRPAGDRRRRRRRAYPAAPRTSRARFSQVDGVLYVTTPDNVWALDAHDGHEIWHYFWRTKGGTHIGNRGVGMWGNYLFFVTPDNYLISLEAQDRQGALAQGAGQLPAAVLPHDGADRRSTTTCSSARATTSTCPGSCSRSIRRPASCSGSGTRRRRRPAIPGSRPGRTSTPPFMAAGIRGCPASYDPETRLYIIGTGNPTPAYTSAPRGDGLDNLFTCALVGDQRRHRQDGVVLPDVAARHARLGLGADAGARRRRVQRAAAQDGASPAARNGYFFVVDRVTGEHLLTSKFSDVGELGQAGAERQGAAGSHPGEGPSHRRRAGVGGQPGRGQLAAAGVQPQTRASSTCRRPRPTRCTT